MKTQSIREATSPRILTLLSVSPHEDDHSFLEAVVAHSTWALFKATTLFAARSVLAHNSEISVVLCDDDLKPGSWADILGHIQSLPWHPSLVVTSKHADASLWAEAINLGAWDVLSKPFDRFEVLRSIKVAWEHWHLQIQMAAGPMKVMRAS